MTCHVGQRGHQIVIHLALKLNVPLIRTTYWLMICGKVDVRIVIASRIGSSCNVGKVCTGSRKENQRSSPVRSIRPIALRPKSSAHDGTLRVAAIGLMSPV